MAKLTYQIILILTVRFVSCGKYWYTPVITINGETVGNVETFTLNFSAEYTLECQAEIYVNFYKNEPGDDRGLLKIENPLYIKAAHANNVGSYYCSLAIWSSIATFNNVFIVAAGLASQVYIFVKDTKQPLVPRTNYNVVVMQYSEVVIPCKPSYLPLQVELLRENNYPLDIPKTYDEKMGYTIRLINTSLNGLALICQTRFESHNFSHKFYLEVEPFDRFYIKPQIRLVLNSSFGIHEGDDFTLNCSVVLPKAIDYKLEWRSILMSGTQDTVGKMTKESYSDSSELEIAKIQLFMKYISRKMGGIHIYYCQITGRLLAGLSQIEIPFNRAPEVIMTPYFSYSTDDEEITLVCTHFGLPPTTVKVFYMSCNPNNTWNCSNEEKMLDFHTTKFQPFRLFYQVTSILFKPSENCTVRCVAENHLGNASAITRVIVENEDFVIEKTNFKKPIMTSDNVTLTCVAKKAHFNSVQWYRYGQLEISSENGIQIISHNTTDSLRIELHFHNIKLYQTGKYVCRATPLLLSEFITYKFVNILVEEYQNPKITKTNLRVRKMIRSVGKSLDLYCYFSGTPTPNIAWFKDDVKLPGKTGSSKIYIRSISAHDFGTYKCVVENIVGVAEESTIVNISTRFRLDSTESTVTNVASSFLLYLILGIIALVAILVACIIYLVIRERNLEKELKAAGLQNFEDGEIDRINPDIPLDEQADFLPYNKKFEFPKDKLQLGRQLGAGAFGVVLQAIAFQIHPDNEETIVAVKVVKKMADNDIMKALVSELKIMANLGRHLNIVNLLGAVTKDIAKRDLMIISEYCPFGNLQDHLFKNRRNFVNQIDPETNQFNHEITGIQESQVPHYENTTALNLILNYFISEAEGESKVSTTNLIAWAFQIARGMEYLASRRVLHGDLASRNVLLCEKNIVKVCDFGLARSLYRSSVYKKEGSPLLPVRWLAPESIGDKVFGTFSDVWSFGIVLWELFSLASSPYPGMELNEEWFLRIKNGYRMEKPEYANDSIYNVMLHCWELDPKSRPTFNELQNQFGSMLPNDVVRHFMGLNGTYMEWNTVEQTDYGTLEESQV